MTPFIFEIIGTAILLLLGSGVVANVNLKNTNAENQSKWVLITSAWGFSVFVGAYISSSYSGAHLNPAVTIGLAVAGKFSWALVPHYILSQLIGAILIVSRASINRHLVLLDKISSNVIAISFLIDQII